MTFFKKFKKSKCNNFDETALLQESEEKINNIKHNAEPASLNFQNNLKRKILEQRRKKFTMDKVFVFINSLINPKRLVPVVSTLVVIGIIVNVVNLESLFKSDPFKQFSKLIISPAYAMDNFQLEPEQQDSLGVQGNSSYILVSKEKIDTDLIKDSIIVEPNIKYDIEQISDTEWKITPSEILPPNTIFKISIKTSFYGDNNELKVRDYSWAYQIKDSFKVLNTIPGNQSTNVPENSGIEITFSHDNYVDYEKYISIEPSFDYKFEKHGRTLVVVPLKGMQKSTVYTVTVKAGLPVSNSAATTAEDYKFSFETYIDSQSNYYNSYFNVYDKFLEFSTKDNPIVKVYSSKGEGAAVGVEVFDLGGEKKYIDALNKRDEIPWWAHSKSKYVYDTSSLQKVSSFSSNIKKEKYTYFIDFPNSLPQGFYIINFILDGAVEQSWFQVTDLGAYINVTKTDTILWIHDLSTDLPAKNASISVVGRSENYSSNEKGVAKFATPEFLSVNVNEPSYFKIKQGAKILILSASSNSNSYYYNDASREDDYWRYLYTDRPKYKPTDIVKFWGMIKDRNNANSKIENAKVVLSASGYFDYYYNQINIAEFDVKLNDFGVFEGEIPVEKLKTGYYNIVLLVNGVRVSDKYINIEDYVKPVYQLSLTRDKKSLFAGDTAKLKVQASFFDGTGAPNLDLKFQMPEGIYNFTTDENGQADLTYKKAYSDCDHYYGCWPKNSWLTVSPKDSELSEISAETSVDFFGASVFADAEVSYPEEGVGVVGVSTYKVDLKKDDPISTKDAVVAPNTKITGKVIKITYEKRERGTYYDFIEKKSYIQYEYDQKEEEVDSFSFFTDQNGKKDYRIKIAPLTSYRVEMKIYDDQGRYDSKSSYLYYYNGNRTFSYSSYYGNYFIFNLKDGTKYSVGDSVVATMSDREDPLPQGDGSQFLFLQLQNGLQEYGVSDSSSYDFNFEKRDIPNINLVGVRYKNGVYISTGTGYFAANKVYYDSEDSKLNIEVKADKDVYKPGEEATFSIQVKDKSGNPKKSSVNINIVDEAYYAVAKDLADPLSDIYTTVNGGSLFSKYTHKTISDVESVEKGGCFASGTKILMEDGTAKNIEEIKIGDRVKTFDDPVKRTQSIGTVINVFDHLVDGYLVINKTLKVTPEHLVYSGYSFKPAQELKVGDTLFASDGRKVFIESIEKKKEFVKVYNFTVDPQHTYIADGFYVHNDKGGAREYFVDAPLFKSVETDRNGRAKITLVLPDNITSWRATVQAISDSFEAGSTTKNISVSLPVFADVTVSSEYLVEDKPIVRLRAFGSKLNKNDDILFTVQSKTLGLDSSTNAKAFKSAYVELPNLSFGKHNITYYLESEKGDDAVKLPIDVISGRLTLKVANSSELTEKTKISSSKNLLTVIVGDKQHINFIDPLKSLSWSYGGRVDQSVVRKQSSEILNDLLDQDNYVPNFSANLYQQADGGIALLPYGGSDLELSALLAFVAKDEFDTKALENYFLNIFNNRNSNREEITLSLFGLSCLNVPVLPFINNWRQRDDLSVKEYIYIALGVSRLGAEELGREIYYSIASNYAKEKLPNIIIQQNDNHTETMYLTSLCAILASMVQAPEHEGLWNSVRTFGYSNEILLDIEKLSYIKETLKDTPLRDAELEYELNGKKHSVSFDENPVFKFYVFPSQVNSLKFNKVEGDLGITVIDERPFQEGDINKDSDISIKREYYVNGKKTESFKDGDLIEVRLYPSLGSKALRGDYQVVDILPSGLIPVTKLLNWDNYSSNCNFWYPYDIEGQKVKYNIWGSWNRSGCSGYISYYARVKTRGSYKAEPATLQSLVNPEYVNYSNVQTISIE